MFSIESGIRFEKPKVVYNRRPFVRIWYVLMRLILVPLHQATAASISVDMAALATCTDDESFTDLGGTLGNVPVAMELTTSMHTGIKQDLDNSENLKVHFDSVPLETSPSDLAQPAPSAQDVGLSSSSSFSSRGVSSARGVSSSRGGSSPRGGYSSTVGSPYPYYGNGLSARTNGIIVGAVFGGLFVFGLLLFCCFAIRDCWKRRRARRGIFNTASTIEEGRTPMTETRETPAESNIRSPYHLSDTSLAPPPAYASMERVNNGDTFIRIENWRARNDIYSRGRASSEEDVGLTPLQTAVSRPRRGYLPTSSA